MRGEVRFCAPLGNDTAEANEVERHLEREGFAELILPRLPHATDFSLLMVLPNGENSIVSTSACSLALSRTQVEPALQGLGEGDVVLLQGNLSLDTTAFILAAAQRQGATTIFNPAPFWPGAEKLVGSAASSSPTASRRVTGGGDPCRQGRHRHARRRRVPADRGAQRRSFPAETVTAIDTTGCGDAFCGVMAAALARGFAIDRAIGAAQKAAALTATRPGAFLALPSREELESCGARTSRSAHDMSGPGGPRCR